LYEADSREFAPSDFTEQRIASLVETKLASTTESKFKQSSNGVCSLTLITDFFSFGLDPKWGAEHGG
jgi:hypothetical protein